MSESGGPAALRGYRLQTLYILSRLMNVESREHIFRPEGKEDLDIYSSSGQLLESVQVKAYTSSLILSDFSPQTDSSFFRRSLRILGDHSDAKIKIVSFGPIGPEIEKAWGQEGPERESVRRKLTEYGYTSKEINGLLTIKFAEVNDSELEDEVFTFLKSTLTGGDPPNAFELMMYWIFLASEQSKLVEYSAVIEKLASVGRYLQQCSTYHDEWFTSILPLIDTLDSDEIDAQHLAKEYYQGVDARYEHILANLDVVRSEKLVEIQRRFESSNVVIVHGASGQGESTLAFRYLHEYIPNVWRFFVRFWEDRKHVLRVASALSGHAKAIDLPCTVYIDVSPSDRDWPELVRELSHLSNINVLVTIREEDWRRATGYRSRFESEELELGFDREEADKLYAQLREHTPRYLAFDESWAGFGGQGPLLEFVYFLTQNQTLKSRVESQIQALKDDVRMEQRKEGELHFLRLVAVASMYEAKLDLRAVVQYLGLNEPSRTIELFTKEYLIRVDESGSTITGLHAVRSNIMLESLLDEVLSSRESVGVECLPLLVEADLEIFLLHAFSRRRTEATSLLEELKSFRPKSWIGVVGILRALLWLGVYDYSESNRALIDEVIGERGPGWILILDTDLSGIVPEAISNFWHNFPDFDGKEQLLEYVESIRARQTPKEEAFVYARDWLRNLDPIGAAPSLPKDFAGLAEVLYWSSHFQISQVILPICEKIDFENIVEEIPIDILADLIYALYIALGKEFDSVFQEFRSRVELRFKRETNTFSLEYDGATVRANFIPDSAYALSQKEHGNEDTASSTLHEETRYRIDLLRKLLPNRQKYGSQGYGHRLGILSPEIDETEKFVDVSNFYPQWAQRINSHFRTLGNYPHRPENWEEHARQILGLRQELSAWLVQLQGALNTFFRRETLVKLFGDLLSSSEWESTKQLTETRPLLPKSAVDEWGFADESFANSSNGDLGEMDVSKLYQQSPALTKHKTYIDALHNYLRHLSNFMTQGLHVIVLNPNLGRAAPGTEQELLRLANENRIKTDQEYLTTCNLHDSLVALKQVQVEFRKRFGRFLPAADLDRLEEQEMKLIRELWPVWYEFAFHPRRKVQNATKEFVQDRDDKLKRIKQGIRRTLKTIRKEDFSAGIARTELQHDRENIPCILLDITNPTMYWQAVEDTVVALQQALHTDNNRSLRHYAIQFWIKHFAIVPLVQGKALSQSVLLLPTFAIKSGSALENWYWYIPKEISDEDWAKLRIPLWDKEQFEPAIRFTDALAKLSVSAAQSGDLSRFSENVEYDDDGVIEKYIQSQDLSNQLQKVFDESLELLNHYNISEIDLEERPLLHAALDIFTQMHQQIRPTEDYHCGISVTVSDLKGWSERLEQVRIQAEYFKLLWIADVLDERTTEG